MKASKNNIIRSSKLDIATKKMINLNHDLVINRGDLDLYLEAKIDDEVVLSKKGDSLVANFVKLFFSAAGEYQTVGDQPWRNVTNPITITNVSSGTGGVVRITVASGMTASATKVSVHGVQGVSINGVYDYNYISTTAIELVGTTYGAGWTSGTGAIQFFLPAQGTGGPRNFADANLIVGTGTTAVAITDWHLDNKIPEGTTTGKLVHNSTIISEDTSDATTAQITITRTFTNSGPSTITINEAGLEVSFGSSSATTLRHLVMRDLLPGGVAVAVGKTLTINYRIKTQLSAGTNPGGFIANFMKMLYKQMAATTRAIIDINNVSTSAYHNCITFNFLSSGGDNRQFYGLDGTQFNTEGWKKGIVVGIGTTSTSMNDYFLETPVEHGSGSGEMLQYGCFVSDYVVDATSAQFKVYKIFENVSGTSITINEIGLTAGAVAYDNSTSAGAEGRLAAKWALIARNILTTPVTVANNEVLKVSYTIRVEV